MRPKVKPSMKTQTAPGLIETRYPLAAEDRHIEPSLVAAMTGRFASFSGTRRDAYDALTSETPIATGVTVEAVETETLRGWWLRPIGAPPDRAMLFLHGGAYMLGSAAAYRGFVSQIAVRAKVNAFVPDYPLAPEHPFPAAYHGAIAAFAWLSAQQIDQFALVGDSAGGGLALALLAEPSIDTSSIASAAVLSPWTDLALRGESIRNTSIVDPIFQPATLEFAANSYLAGADPMDGRASPLYRLPENSLPIAIQVGTNELLLDDSRRYAASAAANGVDVHLAIFEGMHHVFQRSTAQLHTARRALDTVAQFLSKHWK